MTENPDDTRTHLWFRRVARGIAFVGPALLLLILAATFLTRLLD
jgi:hypothetical protein